MHLLRKWTFVLTVAAALSVLAAGCEDASVGDPEKRQVSERGKEEHAHEQADGHAEGETGHAERESEEDHAEDGGHGRGEEEGHGEEAHEDAVKLTRAEIHEFGIEVRTAEPGAVELSRSLPGEVVLNPDRVAHVVPRVPGVVSEVNVGLGDRVQEGQVMAVLVSRELAKARSAYLAGLTRLELAETNFQRVDNLWADQITSEARYLSARQNLQKARLEVQLAERELYALGISEQAVAALPEQPDQALARYELTAPIGGAVIARHAANGEVLHEDMAEPPFVVADLSSVWVQLTVYPKDLAAVRPGQQAVISAGENLKATGTIAYVSPIVDEATRTATARVVLENRDGRWRPGLFVTARVGIGAVFGEVVVPKAALQTLEGQTVVFTQTPEGFEPRPVELGQADGGIVQIVSGLKAGEQYAAAQAFVLKAEMTKEAFGGHAH